MKTTVITSKGTTTIPKEVRDALGLKPGSSINFTVQDGVAHIKRAPTLEEVREQNATLIKPGLLKLTTRQVQERVELSRAKELKQKYGSA